MAIDLHFPPDLEKLRAEWERFAEHECGTYTPLYRDICLAVARKPVVLQLTADGPSHARQPNMLLAAVHYLVLRHDAGVSAGDGAMQRLAALYATGQGDDPGQAFIDVVLAKQAAIADILAARFTQTNECGRSAPLALALAAVASTGGAPGDSATLALIDAGCSAGLNLAVDRYRLDFGSAGVVGPDDGVRVVSELCGPNAERVLPLPKSIDSVGWRKGLERAPVDLHDDEAVSWMLACLWPEHDHRLERASAAFESLRGDPPEIIRGDMVEDLPALIGEAPADMLVTVLTSWAAAYLRRADRARLVEVFRAASMERPIVWLSMEAPGVAPGLALPTFNVESATSPSLVGALRFDRGNATPTTIGWTHPHGAWFAPV